MSNYTVITDWDGKDALADSNPAKVISGDEFQDEFDAVATAVATKADINGSATEVFSCSTAASSSNTTVAASTAFVTTAVSGKQDTLTNITDSTSANGYGTRTVSTSAPSGGSDEDIWYRY